MSMSSVKISKHLQCIMPEEIISLSRDTGVCHLTVTESIAISELVAKFTSESSSRSSLDAVSALMMNITNSIQTFSRVPTIEEVRLCCKLAHIEDEAAVTQVQYLRLFDIFKKLLAIQSAATKQSESCEQISAKHRELNSELAVTVSAMCTGTPFLFRGTVLPIEILTHLAAKFGLDATKWFIGASTLTMLPTNSVVVQALDQLLTQQEMEEDESEEMTSQVRMLSPLASSLHKQNNSRSQQQTVNYISVRMMSEMFTPVNDKLVQVFRTYFGASDPNDPHGVFGVNDLVGGHLALQLSLLSFRNKLCISEKKLRQLILQATEPLVVPQPTGSGLASLALDSRRSIVVDDFVSGVSFSGPVDDQSTSPDRKRQNLQPPLYDDQPSDAETIFANGFIRYPDFECIVRFLSDDQQGLDAIKADQRLAASAVVNARKDDLHGGAADAERLLIDAQTAMIDKFLRAPVPQPPIQPAALKMTAFGVPLQQALAELPKVTPSGLEVSKRSTPQTKTPVIPLRPIDEPAKPPVTLFKGSMVPRRPPGQLANTGTIFVSPNTSVQWHATASGDAGRGYRLQQQQQQQHLQQQQSAANSKGGGDTLLPLQLAHAVQQPPHMALRALLGRSAQTFLYEEPSAVVGGVDLRHTLVDLGGKQQASAVAASASRSAPPDLDALEEMDLENIEVSLHAGRGPPRGRRHSFHADLASGDDDIKPPDQAAVSVSGTHNVTDVEDASIAAAAASQALSNQSRDSCGAYPAAVESPLNDRPRWRNVKHIPRYDGQEISAYTSLPSSAAVVSPQSPTARPVVRVPLLKPVEVKPMVPQREANVPEERKSSSARAPSKPRQSPAPVQPKKRNPPAEPATSRPVTSDRPKKPQDAGSAQHHPLVSSSSPVAVGQPLRSQPKPMFAAPVSPPGMAPASLPPTHMRQSHPPFAATASFPREVGAEIWNVLGVRAVPDGFPQMQFMGSSEVTRHPRADFNSLHSAVLSFNKYQMEAFRLR